MGGGGRTDRGLRRRGDAAGVVVPLPRRIAEGRLDLARFVPSARSLALGFGLVIGAFAAYWGARISPLFDVQRVEIQGAPPPVARSVDALVSHTVGTSLLAVNAGVIEASVRALPTVAAATVDRDFPHTLIVRVAAARPVVVARQGHDAWLVTGHNLVIGAVKPTSQESLPRIWLPKTVSVRVGALLPDSYRPGTRALAELQRVRFGGRVTTVRTDGELTLVLQKGLWVELGDESDLALKLAVAGQVLPLLASDAAYLDVSVPERPVSGTSLNSQVEVKGSSTSNH